MTGLLALLSFLTSSRQWDGGFPAGEFRINIISTEGHPVQSAVLHIYHGGTRNLAFDYPLENHSEGDLLVSDRNGRITALRTRGGLQFGGSAWRLFWVIRMGAGAPQYDCEITAEGFKPLQFDVHRLFKSPHRYYGDFPKTKRVIDGQEIELAVRENTFTMDR